MIFNSLFRKQKVPPILQGELSECGLACLAMILNFYGHEVSLISLRKLFPVSLDGLRLNKIMAWASSLGLSTRALKVELEDAEHLQLPAIIHWNMTHFVVLTKVKKNTYTINDPGRGTIKLSESEFSQSFTGIALELQPTSNFERKKEKKSLTFMHVLSSVPGLLSNLIYMILLSVFIVLFETAFPMFYQIIIDRVLPNKSTEMLWQALWIFSGIVILQSIVIYIRTQLNLWMNYNISKQLGTSIFRHMIRLPLSFFSNRHTADIVSRFSAIQPIRDMLSEGVVQGVVDGIVATVMIGFMIFLSPLLTTLVLLTYGSIFTVKFLFLHKMRNLSEKSLVSSANESASFMETVRSMQAIKIFGGEWEREQRWHNLFADFLNHKATFDNLNVNLNNFESVAKSVGNIVVLTTSTFLVISNEFSVGFMVAFLMYTNQLNSKLESFFIKFSDIKMMTTHLDRLSAIVLEECEDYSYDEQDIDQTKGKIVVNNLSFRYDSDNPMIFSNLSFSVEPGESVALVGPSGSGKTSLLKIMMGMLSPSSGEVIVDNLNYNHKNQKMAVRKMISAVMQDDTLFSGSIEENISFFDPQVDREWVAECAKIAMIYDEIDKKPMKFNTLIGEMGSTLSGGQVQRILLARALYRKPKILFLDEATSALDANLEIEISNNIKKLDITRIMIAHRTETIRTADRVIKIGGIE